ncbi:hypothetical protein VP01_111g16 [Puccinia sorghi]|uniref:Uncharacterized protein n=1 Tax=Puccinia sorghi TaxID=27349 RepID=A0A0L6VSG0_9BASI|nr:hypothetical protein VP01_111g16 [Puccinia sorghi]
MNTIADIITHSGKDVTIDSVLDHLCLHAENQHVRASGSGTKSDPITLFTNEVDTRCKQGAHNTAANHTEENCWFLHPGMRKAHMEKIATLKNEAPTSKK